MPVKGLEDKLPWDKTGPWEKKLFLTFINDGYVTAAKLKERFQELKDFDPAAYLAAHKRIRKYYTKHLEKTGELGPKPNRNNYSIANDTNAVVKNDVEEEDEEEDVNGCKFYFIIGYFSIIVKLLIDHLVDEEDDCSDVKNEDPIVAKQSFLLKKAAMNKTATVLRGQSAFGITSAVA